MRFLATLIFLIIRIVSNPVANVFQKKISNDISCVVINFYSYLILSILCLPFCSKYLSYEMITSYFILLTLLAGFLCALGTVCVIKAINIGELSVIGPINSYKSVVGLISAFIFLKEIPSVWALFGIFLIIYGSKYVFDCETEGFSFKLLKRKDVQLRFLGLILTGIEAAILKNIILISSVEACFIFWCFMGLLWSFIFSLITKKDFSVKSKNVILNLFIIAVCLGLMQYSTNFVFERMNVGYALALFQLSSLLTVFFGYKFFKEKSFKRKLLGSLIMIIGSVFIILCH